MARKRGRSKTGAQFNAEINRLTKQLNRKYKTGNQTAIEVKKTMLSRKIKFLEKAKESYDTALTLEGQARKDQFLVSEKNKLEADKIKLGKYSVNKKYSENFNLDKFKGLYTLDYHFGIASDTQGDIRLQMDAESRFNQMFLKQLYKQGYISDYNNVEAAVEALGGFTPQELYESYKRRGGKWEKWDYEKLANDENFIKEMVKIAEMDRGSQLQEDTNPELAEFRTADPNAEFNI